jgi:hypothetical protein
MFQNLKYCWQWTILRYIAEDHSLDKDVQDSHYEVIPFLRITSSVSVGFPHPLFDELGREYDLTALKAYVIPYLHFLKYKTLTKC